MDTEQIAECWYEECQDRGLSTDAYSALKQGLRDFLPRKAAVGIAYRDEEPLVIALAEEALLVFTPPAGDKLLDALMLPIRTVAALGATSFARNAEASFRACRWAISAPLREVAPLETRHPVGAGLAIDNGGEAVMLAVAEHLGWSSPLGGSEEGKG